MFACLLTAHRLESCCTRHDGVSVDMCLYTLIVASRDLAVYQPDRESYGCSVMRVSIFWSARQTFWQLVSSSVMSWLLARLLAAVVQVDSWKSCSKGGPSLSSIAPAKSIVFPQILCYLFSASLAHP